MFAHYWQKIEQIGNLVNEKAVQEMLDSFFAAWSGGNQVFVCGRGTSAPIARTLAAAVTRETSGSGKSPLIARCINPDEDEIETDVRTGPGSYSEKLSSLAREGDLLVSISESSHCAALDEALATADKIGMDIVIITSSPRSLTERIYSSKFVCVEVVSGSTRQVRIVLEAICGYLVTELSALSQTVSELKHALSEIELYDRS